ncbi:hypothetical protein DLM75_16475 [Leptospira stimsonii]|uniref:Uncharacterized protein n=1 Tax=Leptospira stimsonii TaxID=2202203 RepID=A0A396Z6U0_9LEPT|nr:hypothetical protein DLM75_16475 [Leptospira stimsonii]
MQKEEFSDSGMSAGDFPATFLLHPKLSAALSTDRAAGWGARLRRGCRSSDGGILGFRSSFFGRSFLDVELVAVIPIPPKTLISRRKFCKFEARMFLNRRI